MLYVGIYYSLVGAGFSLVGADFSPDQSQFKYYTNDYICTHTLCS